MATDCSVRRVRCTQAIALDAPHAKEQYGMDILDALRREDALETAGTSGNWIKLNPGEAPVDGINMDRITSFICQGDLVMLYVGWVPDGKTPWLTLRGENARQVKHWLARRELIYL
jgi:hypothetical protein